MDRFFMMKICKRSRYTEIVNTSYQVATPVRVYTFCFSIPPKCSKYKIVYKTKYRLEVSGMASIVFRFPPTATRSP